MALVRYNRNYTVQSGPRQPARRNPGALPEAAGAFLRGASGIHEGDMAVGRALLASNEARTKRELARASDAGRHWQEAGQIVAAAGKGLGEIADAYQRAQARRLRDEIEKGEADFGMDLAEKAPSIMATKAVVSSKEGADAVITDGRAFALGRAREAFEKSDAFTKLSDEAKEALRRRMKARMIPYMAKANELDHRQLADDRQRNLARSFDSLKAGMDMNLGTDETERAAWNESLGQVKAKAESIIRQKAGIDDIGPDGGAIAGTPTKEQQEEIERLVGDTVRGLRTERLKHWFAQLEDPDTDAAAMKNAIGREINEANFPSDADRLALERARDAAIQKRDAAIAQGMSDAVAAITLDPAASPDPDAAFNAAREKANGISSAALRAKVLDGIDKADADIQFNGFLDAVDAAAPGEELSRTDVFLGENSAWFASAMQDAERLPSPDARARAVSWLLSGRATVEKAENQAAEEQAQKQASELLSRVVTGYGYDAGGTQVTLTPAERASAFRALYPLLTPQQRREYGEAIRKAAMSGASVSLADIDQVGRAAGVENLSAFFAPPQPGKDPSLDKEKLRKDGTVTIDPAGLGNKFSMPADAMMEMVEAIRQYKSAVAVAGERAGVRNPAQIWESVLADKTAYKGYCEAAHRRAVAQALTEYAAAYPAVLMPPREDEQR